MDVRDNEPRRAQLEYYRRLRQPLPLSLWDHLSILGRRLREGIAKALELAPRWRGIAAIGAGVMLAQMGWMGHLANSPFGLGNPQTMYRATLRMGAPPPDHLHFGAMPEANQKIWMGYASLFACSWWLALLAAVAFKRRRGNGKDRYAANIALVLVGVEWSVMVVYFAYVVGTC